MAEVCEAYHNWKIEVLEELRPFITSNLQPEKLYAYLRSKFVLSEDDQEDIEAERTRRRKAERMLDYISKRGNEGFDELCEAIRQNKTQNFLLQKIIARFEAKKYSHQADRCNVIETNHLHNETGYSQTNLPVPGDPDGPPLPPDAFVYGDLPTSPPPAYTEIFQQQEHCS